MRALNNRTEQKDANISPEKLNSLEELREKVKSNYNYLFSKSENGNKQHQLLLLSLARICKFFEAYILLVKNGYGEPAINLIRSIFEGLLWMRWIVISDNNAELYWNSGLGEIQSIAYKLIGRGLVKIKGLDDAEGVRKMLAKKDKKISLPKFEDIAKDTGMIDIYDSVYKTMSAMSHGTVLSIGERALEKKVSPEADSLNINLFFDITPNLVIECCKVANSWIEEFKIHEAPRFNDYFTSDWAL